MSAQRKTPTVKRERRRKIMEEFEEATPQQQQEAFLLVLNKIATILARPPRKQPIGCATENLMQ